MWEEKNDQEESVEISFVDLFWSTLRKWRSIIAATLIVGVLLAGLGAAKEYRDLANEKVVNERQEAYEAAMETYQLNKTQLETTLENLREDLERQQFYEENAIMLFVDQYNVYTRAASYYIDTNYEIAPELYFQNPNFTGVITKSYKAALDRLNLDDIIATADKPNLTTRNPLSGNLQIISTTIDEGNGILNVTVCADTQERADKIFEAVKETLTEQESLLDQVIGEHTLGILSERSYTDIDTRFGDLQNSFKGKVESISEGIETTNKKLEELKEPVNETPSAKTVIRKGIKFGVVGAVLGLACAIFFHLLRLIFRDRLDSTEELLRRYQTPVLGVLTEKKKRLKIDRALSAKLGIEAKDAGEEESYIAANIRFYKREKNRILLVGNCGGEKLHMLREKLSPLLEGTEILVGGNVNESPAAVDALRQETTIVSVEEWLKTSHKEIRHELQAIRSSGNQHLGFIVLG